MNLAINWVEAASAQLSGEELKSDQENAIIRLLELSSEEPDEALTVIYEIVRRKPDLKIINYLGAGPLEELLVKHCDYLEAIISHAEHDELLRQCLAHVNLELEDCANAYKLHQFINSDKL